MERTDNQLIVGAERFLPSNIHQHRRRGRVETGIKFVWRNWKISVHEQLLNALSFVQTLVATISRAGCVSS
jgi:hypothetical protein